jgi:hypothetical protein
MVIPFGRLSGYNKGLNLKHPLSTTLLLLTACQKPTISRQDPEGISLPKKVEIYEEGLQDRVDSMGCDQLLFASLLGSVGYELDIERHEGEPGQWFRTPNQDCYETGRSGSTISRDMLLGLLFYGYHRGELDLLDRLYHYGKENNWKMGDGSLSRIYLTPVMQKTLALAIEKLGGESYPESTINDSIEWKIGGQKGFEAHLMVLHVLLRGDILGKITKDQNKRLSEQYGRVSDSGLNCYIYGLFNRDSHLPESYSLTDDPKFPNDRLPTSNDRCTPWVWERDPKDWVPCSEQKKIHTGGDFLFLAKRMEG